MPLYYFNLYNDVTVIDGEGKELPDIEAARAEAKRNAISLICQSVQEGHINLRHRIEVEDEDRRPVLTLPFGSVIEIES